MSNIATRPPGTNPKNPSGFKAPGHTRKMIGKQTAISLALPPHLLEKIDQMSNSLSITRAAFIKQALTKAIQAESN